MRTYVVICPNVVGNSKAGFVTVYSGSGKRHPTREEAIEEGFEFGRADDFNVGVLEGDRLISVDWMHEEREQSERELRGVAEQMGFEYP